jgi:hypothetical protein
MSGKPVTTMILLLRWGYRWRTLPRPSRDLGTPTLNATGNLTVPSALVHQCFVYRVHFVVHTRVRLYGTSMEMLARSVPGVGDIVAQKSLVRIQGWRPIGRSRLGISGSSAAVKSFP